MTRTIVTALFVSAICEWIAGHNRTASRQLGMALAASKWAVAS